MKEWVPGFNKRHKWFKKKKDFEARDGKQTRKMGIGKNIRCVSRKRQSCTSCKSSNWGSRIHSTNIQTVLP